LTRRVLRAIKTIVRGLYDWSVETTEPLLKWGVKRGKWICSRAQSRKGMPFRTHWGAKSDSPVRKTVDDGEAHRRGSTIDSSRAQPRSWRRGLTRRQRA